jgi:hypothetical protein
LYPSFFLKRRYIWGEENVEHCKRYRHLPGGTGDLFKLSQSYGCGKYVGNEVLNIEKCLSVYHTWKPSISNFHNIHH